MPERRRIQTHNVEEVRRRQETIPLDERTSVLPVCLTFEEAAYLHSLIIEEMYNRDDTAGSIHLYCMIHPHDALTITFHKMWQAMLTFGHIEDDKEDEYDA